MMESQILIFDQVRRDSESVVSREVEPLDEFQLGYGSRRVAVGQLLLA